MANKTEPSWIAAARIIRLRCDGLTAGEIARKLDRPLATVTQALTSHTPDTCCFMGIVPSIPHEMIGALGTQSDAIIASRFFCSRAFVNKLRKALRIKSIGHWPAAYDWTPERLALLGSDSDEHVARQLGLARHTVGHKRRSFGIPSTRPRSPDRINWTPEMLYLLGKVSDREFRKRFHVSIARIRIKRNVLRIRAWGRPAIAWTPKQMADLRALSMTAFAEKYGLPRRQVIAKRLELGLPASSRKPPVEFTPAMVALLSERSDRRLARAFHLNIKQISKERERRGIPSFHQRKWTPDNLALLGAISDRELARRMGVCISAVFNMRAHKGIPAFNTWAPAQTALLGTDTDATIALLVHRSTGRVAARRKELGIPSSYQQRCRALQGSAHARARSAAARETISPAAVPGPRG